jgi:hypothetical protein
MESKFLNDKCGNWFNLIDDEIGKVCGTQVRGQFLENVVGKLGIKIQFAELVCVRIL